MTENITSFFHTGKWKAKLENWMWSGFAKVFNQASIVTASSEFAAQLIRPKLNSEVLAISNGIGLEKFNPIEYKMFLRDKYSILKMPILLYVGRLDPEKKIDQVLIAVAESLKRINFCFVIAGKGSRRLALKNLAKELVIQKNVVFTGFAPDKDLPALYKASRCFITASIAELQSITTLEAMASGLPVIAVNAGALNELVNNEINGYLFDPGDIYALLNIYVSYFLMIVSKKI